MRKACKAAGRRIGFATMVLALASAACSGGQPADIDDEAAIYAAAAYHLAVETNTFGPDHRFSELVVVDGPVADVPPREYFSARPLRPFDAMERSTIESELLELSPVTFVELGSDGRREGDQPMGEFAFMPAIPGSAILTLGLVDLTADERAEVGVSLWCGMVCGFWATFVLEREGTAWVVTGTTGEVGIS